MKLHWRIALLLCVVFAAVVAAFPADACAQTASASSSAPAPKPSGHRPSVLMLSSYAVTAIVQGLDAHSTFKAIDAGAVETNPLLTPLANNRPAFVALKAAIAAALIYEGHGTSKQHKIRAVLILGAIDTAYVALARHNYQVATVMKSR
jgi:hypothetical protein